MNGFKKAEILKYGETAISDTSDSEADGSDDSELDQQIADLFCSDTEEESFHGFNSSENETDESDIWFYFVLKDLYVCLMWNEIKCNNEMICCVYF